MTADTEMNTFDNKAYVADVDDNANSKRNDVLDFVNSKPSRLDGLSQEERRTLKRGIIKNVVIISFAFMLLFTAFQSMANLQSSLNKV